MKYTAEEVRAVAKRLHDDITVVDGDALMASDMLTANAALVEAMKLPDGYEVVEHLPGIWGYEYDRDDGERMASSASWNHPALAAIGAWRDHVEALAESAEPVAQPADSGRVTVGMAGTMPGTDGFTMALFKASDVPVGTELYTAPPAQPAERVPEGLPYPKLGPEQEACDGYVYECGYTDGWNACRDAMLASPAQPAQSVDVAKVREVIAELREADSPSPLRFREWADKLEAALPESKP